MTAGDDIVDNPRIWRLWLTLFLVVSAAAGCAPTATPTRVARPPTPVRLIVAPSAVPPTVAPTFTPAPTATVTGAVTVLDDADRAVTLFSEPQRIVSLAPSTTEIAFALGLGSRVIAVDAYSDYPAEARRLAQVNTSPLNLEQLVASKPDLVLVAGITSGDDIRKMVNLHLVVLVAGAPKMSFESIMADIVLVGKATGTAAKARSLTDSMTQSLDALQRKIADEPSRPRVYWELDATDPSGPLAPGPGSFVNDIIVLAGGTNITSNAKSPYAQVNMEEIIASDPEVIIFSNNGSGTTVKSIRDRKGWSEITAVKNDKVFMIEDGLVSRPGPRAVDGVLAAATMIHPALVPAAAGRTVDGPK